MIDSRDIPDLLRGVAVFPAELPDFDASQATDTPVELFVQWLRMAIAQGVQAPHAMTLATVDASAPDARVVILRDVSAQGWSFATSDESPKGRHLEALPAAALTFFWPEVGRQIRIQGSVRTASNEESASDFRRRHPAARALVLARPQSSPVQDGRSMDEALAVSLERIRQDPQLTSTMWTVYFVLAHKVEFWQAASDRNHTRLRYIRNGEHWTKERLWP